MAVLSWVFFSFQVFSWFQRRCEFKRCPRHLCNCIPNFPNPQPAFSIWTNTFYSLKKIHYAIWTNTCYHLDKYFVQPIPAPLLLHSKLSKSTSADSVLLHKRESELKFTAPCHLLGAVVSTISTYLQFSFLPFALLSLEITVK